VITDYDVTVNFSDFKTYRFYEDAGNGLSDLDVKRVLSTINSAMKQRAFQEAENPDFYINVISKISESRNNNSIGIGFGNGGFGISGGVPIIAKKIHEEFIIEFVNSKTNQIIWEGIVNSELKEKRRPEEKELHFTEIIDKILSKYPPKKNSSKN
jgi:hypothetical protein